MTLWVEINPDKYLILPGKLAEISVELSDMARSDEFTVEVHSDNEVVVQPPVHGSDPIVRVDGQVIEPVNSTNYSS